MKRPSHPSARQFSTGKTDLLSLKSIGRTRSGFSRMKLSASWLAEAAGEFAATAANSGARSCAAFWGVSRSGPWTSPNSSIHKTKPARLITPLLPARPSGPASETKPPAFKAVTVTCKGALTGLPRLGKPWAVFSAVKAIVATAPAMVIRPLGVLTMIWSFGLSARIFSAFVIHRSKVSSVKSFTSVSSSGS